MAARKPRPATPDQLLGALSDIALGRCSYPETDKTGKVIQQMPDVSARLKALELLGKRYRLFSEPAAEPGEFQVFAGTDSSCTLCASFRLEQQS